jgi:hypothetical protein
MTPVRFPYVERTPGQGRTSLAPLLPLRLSLGSQSLSVLALVDSGASLNVLPLGIGLQLGAQWDQQTVEVPLAGTLSGIPARGLLLTGTVASFSPTQLVFAWAASDQMPIILGQTNFFAEFDICFFRDRSIFEIRPK